MLSRRASSEVRTGRRARRGIVLALASLAACSVLRAEEIAWDNSSGDFLWGTAGNWAGDALPSAADGVIFGDAGVGTINLGGQTRSVDALTLSNAVGEYTLTNALLMLDSITQAGNSSTLTTTIGARPALLTVDVQANTLSLNGHVSAAGLTKSGEGTLVLGGTSNTFTAPITVAGGMLMATTTSALGSGTVRLAGGDLTLRPASPGAYFNSVELAADAAITASRSANTGGTSSVASLALGNFTLNVGSDAGVRFEARTLTVGSSARIEASTPLGLATSSSATLDGALTISNTSEVWFGGISGPGSVTCEGPANVIAGLGSTNWIVNGGTLQVAYGGNVTINPNGAALIARNTIGGITLNGGNLSLRKDASMLASGGVVTVTAVSRINVDATGNPTSLASASLAGLTLTGPTLTVANANNAQLVAASLAVSGASTLHNTATLAGFSGVVALKFDQATLTQSLTVTGNGTTSLEKLSGSGDLIMNGTGSLAIENGGNTGISVNGSWKGRLIIESGTVKLGQNILSKGLGSNTDSLVVPDGATLVMDGIASNPNDFFPAWTRSLSITGHGNGGAGAISYASASHRDGIIAAPVTLNGPTTILVEQVSLRRGLHIGDPFTKVPGGAIGGTGPLVKTGGRDLIGALYIHVPATYTGGTIIEAGTVAIGSDGSLVGTGPVIVKPTGILSLPKPAGSAAASHSVNPQSVTLAGGALALGADMDPRQFLSAESTGGSILFGANCARDLNLSQLIPGVSGSAWKVGGGAHNSVTHSGTIRFDDPETARFEGPGTLILTSDLKAANNIAAVTVSGIAGGVVLKGNNDYAGDTVIIGGTLTAFGDGSLGSSRSPILLGDSQANTDKAALYVGNGHTLTRDIVVRDGSTGIVAIGIDPTYYPATAEIKGTISLGRSIEIGHDYAFSTVTLSGPISGTGGITARSSSSGTVVVSGENTYSGPTVVEKVLLDASTTGNRALGNSASITINSGGIVRLRGPENHAPGATIKVLKGGTLSVAANYLPSLTADSTGTFGIDIDGFDSISSLASLGKGTMSMGSTRMGSFAGLTLGPCTDNVYRLGGGRGTLTIENPVLVNSIQARSLSVARDGTIILHGDNSYSGSSTVEGTLQAGDGGRVLGASKSVTISTTGQLRLVSPNNYAPNAVFAVSGVLAVADHFLPPMTATSSGILAVDTEGFEAITNLASLGNGSMSLSSTTVGTLASTELLPGSGNTWRFGGGGGILTVLTDLKDAPGVSRAMLVSRAGSVVLAGTNTFTGGITVDNEGELVVSGRVISPVTLKLATKARFLSDQNLPSIATFSTQWATMEVADGVVVTAQAAAGHIDKTGPGTFHLPNNTGVPAGGWPASPKFTAYVYEGEVLFSASQDLMDLSVSESASHARAILGPGVALRIYGHYSTSDKAPPDRYSVEHRWIEISSGFGQGKSGIDLDASIDRDVYALGLLMALDARSEPHALIKALLRGDIDGSGAVNHLDAGIMLTSFDQAEEAATMSMWFEGDLTYDGLLNEYDVGELARAMNYPFDPSAGMDSALSALRSMAAALSGDANLDGHIDALDYFALDAALLAGHAATWCNGDFDYNGILNGDDYFLLDRAFLNQTALPSLGSTANVPEPAALTVLLAGLLLVRRRRR